MNITIELTYEDLRFKHGSPEYDAENIRLLAVALETVEYVKTKYAQDVVYQKSIIDCLKTILGEKNHSIEPREFSWWEKPKKSQYDSKLADMISEYMIKRIVGFDQEKKSFDEVSAWLRCMAKN